ncbi:hypothetical protein L8106_10542 [Lyngbya sp. PCC 8106]|nr:hypothetical protein L8106_10542 [Lyngbya sp. PCC 8106]
MRTFKLLKAFVFPPHKLNGTEMGLKIAIDIYKIK